jgi:hypothetical protein
MQFLIYALIALLAIQAAPVLCGYFLAGWLLLKVIRLFCR